MKTMHTPGPWMWDEPLPRSHSEGNWKEHAPWLVNNNTGEGVLTGEIACSNTADARLIAAAPDLLSALIEIAEWVDRYTTPGHPVATVARAVIAKAKGDAS